MIEFKGELSQDCKKFLFRKQTVSQLKVSLFTATFFIIILLFVAIPDNLKLLLFLIPIVAFVLFSIIPPSKETQKIIVPKRIYIDLDNGEIVQQCEKIQRSHSIESVKAVTDYGDWYYFEFDFGNRDLYFICQKDLLTQGTTEEFEALFSDKIKKKYYH